MTMPMVFGSCLRARRKSSMPSTPGSTRSVTIASGATFPSLPIALNASGAEKTS